MKTKKYSNKSWSLLICLVDIQILLKMGSNLNNDTDGVNIQFIRY